MKYEHPKEEAGREARWVYLKSHLESDTNNCAKHPEAILSMTAEELITYARGEQLKSVMRFIEGCSVEEAAKIIEEIRCVHDNLLVWDAYHQDLTKVRWVNINKDRIQLNLQEYPE